MSDTSRAFSLSYFENAIASVTPRDMVPHDVPLDPDKFQDEFPGGRKAWVLYRLSDTAPIPFLRKTAGFMRKLGDVTALEDRLDAALDVRTSGMMAHIKPAPDQALALVGIKLHSSSLAQQLNQEADRLLAEREEEAKQAFRKARAHMAEIAERIQSQPKPYVNDTFGGLTIEAEAPEGERRWVELVFEDREMRASLFDTVRSGAVGGASKVETAQHLTWPECAEWIEEKLGVSFRPSWRGEELRGIQCGDSLMFHTATRRALCSIDMHPRAGGAIHLYVRTPEEDGRNESFMEWPDAAKFLAEHGFDMTPVVKAPENASSASPRRPKVR